MSKIERKIEERKVRVFGATYRPEHKLLRINLEIETGNEKWETYKIVLEGEDTELIRKLILRNHRIVPCAPEEVAQYPVP